MCLKTFLYTKVFGNFVGSDQLGNSYYESQHKRWFGKKNRWVIYQKDNRIISNIDTIWYKWLHYMIDIPPMKLKKSYHWMIDSGVTQYDKVNIKESKAMYDGKYLAWNHKNTK